MQGENYMLINQEEMRRAVAIYMAEAFKISEKDFVIVTNVRQCKFANKIMFEIKLTQQDLNEGNNPDPGV